MAVLSNKSHEAKLRYLLRRIRLAQFMIWEDILPTLVNGSYQSILDLGCGEDDSMAWIIRKGRPGLVVGMDAEPSLLRTSLRRRVHDFGVIGDLRFLPFREKSVDVCLLIGVLTYLDKGDGIRLLQDAERISKKQVVTCEPVGVLPDRTTEYFRQFQRYDEGGHRSAWYVEDFAALGYRVIGFNGIRGLRNRKGKLKPRQPLKLLFGMMSYATQFFVYHKPKIAFAMAGTKELNV